METTGPMISRAPTMPQADLQRLTALLASQGYDIGRLRQVPQQRRAVTEP